MKLSEVFYHWERTRKDLFETLARFETQELGFSPFEGSWSVREIIFHIANAEDGWFRYALTRELEGWPAEKSAEDFPDVASLMQYLIEIHARTVAYLKQLDTSDWDRPITLPWGPEVPLNWIFWHVVEHEIHHRGELSLILGMLGKEGVDI